jgi:SOS response regulatory protein OraA/RecX
MGELLQFPGSRAGSDAQETKPFDGAQGSGVERRSAPSRHPSRGRAAAGESALGPEARRDVDEHDRDVSEARAEEEARAATPSARWAVPGVDGEEAAPPIEPTRASKRAENVALAALTRHDASEGEIRAKLVAKGLDAQDVEAELDRLRRVGLIDDTAFATRLIDRLRERKGLGDQAIRSTLRGRLVPQDVVDAVLADQAEEPEETEARLLEVAADRAKRLGSLPYEVAERRLMAYLMRKGYSGSAVRTATRAALDAAGIR